MNNWARITIKTVGLFVFIGNQTYICRRNIVVCGLKSTLFIDFYNWKDICEQLIESRNI